MPSRGEREGEERSKRQDRADRILDAALELLERWGYRKTTLDDIAKQAGVAKGTIYLHWKTREALFEALLLREYVSIFQEIKQRIANDPAGATLSCLIRHIGSMATSNALLRVALLQDSETLGDLIRTSTGQRLLQIRMETSQTYLELLRDKGLLYSDITMETQIKMMAAICMGFFSINRFMPLDRQFAPQELMEALAITLHRTFEPEEPPTPQVLEAAKRIFNQQLDQFLTTIERIRREIE